MEKPLAPLPRSEGSRFPLACSSISKLCLLLSWPFPLSVGFLLISPLIVGFKGFQIIQGVLILRSLM